MSLNVVQLPEPINRFVNMLDIATLRDAVAHGPAEIKAAREKIQQAKDKVTPIRRYLAEAQEELVNAEAVLMIEISSETDEKDKPRYSNEAMRKAELAKRRKDDLDVSEAQRKITAIQEQLNRADSEVAQAESELQFRLDMFKGNLAQLANSTALLETAAAYKGVA